MFSEILGLFKTPVTTMSQRAQERNVKKELITGAIIAIVLALVTVITSYISVIKYVNKQYPSLEKYNEDIYYNKDKLTKEEFKTKKSELKKEELEDKAITKTFFRTAGISAASIALVAGILYVIARMVKSPKDYIELFAMTNGAYILYAIGVILKTIFSYIYLPLSIIISVGFALYAIISLCNTFNYSLDVEDPDKLAMYSTIVLTILFAIFVIAATKYLTALSASIDLEDVTSMFSDISID